MWLPFFSKRKFKTLQKIELNNMIQSFSIDKDHAEVRLNLLDKMKSFAMIFHEFVKDYPNYIELHFNYIDDKTSQPLIVTIQKANGKTPGQLKSELEKENIELKKQLEEFKKDAL